MLEALILWGVPLMTEENPEDAVRSHWLASALELMLTDREPDGAPVTLELHTGDQPIVVESRDGAARARLGTAENPDATLAGPPRPIMLLLLGLIDLAGGRASGVSYEGDPAVLGRFGSEMLPAALAS